MTLSSRAAAFGRRPHDPVRVAAAQQHVVTYADVTRLDRKAINFQPGLYQNDTWPDCTTVGLANFLTAVCLIRGDFAPALPAQGPQDLYKRLAGLPANATDAQVTATDGLVMQDVLEDVATHQPFTDAAGPWSTFEHAAVDVTNRAALLHAMATAGAGYWGVTLTNADMQAWAVGATWDDDGSDTSGPAGGHCLLGWDAPVGLGDTDPVRLATWGALQTATWRWVSRRLEEAWALDARLVLAP